jgi:MFS family permease
MFWLRHLNESSTYAGDVLGPLIVLGLGVGMIFAPAIATATVGVPERDAGVGSAMVNTSQQIGGAVGTAVLSTIFTSALTRYMSSHPPGPQAQSAAAIHGYTVAFSVACGLFLVCAVITATLLRSGQLPTDHAEDEPADDEDVDLATLRCRVAELESETVISKSFCTFARSPLRPIENNSPHISGTGAVRLSLQPGNVQTSVVKTAAMRRTKSSLLRSPGRTVYRRSDAPGASGPRILAAIAPLRDEIATASTV